MRANGDDFGLDEEPVTAAFEVKESVKDALLRHAFSMFGWAVAGGGLGAGATSLSEVAQGGAPTFSHSLESAFIGIVGAILIKLIRSDTQVSRKTQSHVTKMWRRHTDALVLKFQDLSADQSVVKHEMMESNRRHEEMTEKFLAALKSNTESLNRVADMRAEMTSIVETNGQLKFTIEELKRDLDAYHAKQRAQDAFNKAVSQRIGTDLPVPLPFPEKEGKS